MVEDPPQVAIEDAFSSWGGTGSRSALSSTSLKGTRFGRDVLSKEVGHGYIPGMSDDSPVMIDGWWMNEWMIETSEEPLVSFCISLGCHMDPWPSLDLYACVAFQLRGASEGNIRSNQPCYHGRFAWNRGALSGFPSHVRCRPQPRYKRLAYVSMIFLSIFLCIHSSICHNTYPFSNNHGSDKITLI